MPEKTVVEKNRYRSLEDLKKIIVFSGNVKPEPLSKEELRMKLK